MKFYNVIKRARKDSKRSQEDVSKRMRIAKKTYQNWESGVTCPSADDTIPLFHALGVSPLPYLFTFLYPGEFEELDNDSSDEEMKKALIKLVSELTPSMQRKLLYCFMGQHGSSFPAIIELLTAHLHTPLEYRLNISKSIITNFKVSKQKGTLVGKDNIMPDIGLLEHATEKGEVAVMNGDKSYTALL